MGRPFEFKNIPNLDETVFSVKIDDLLLRFDHNFGIGPFFFADFDDFFD
jgi:hypothetical protein